MKSEKKSKEKKKQSKEWGSNLIIKKLKGGKIVKKISKNHHKSNK